MSFIVFLDINKCIQLVAKDQVSHVTYHEKTTEVSIKSGSTFLVKGPFHDGETFKEALQQVSGIRNGLLEEQKMLETKKHCCECSKLLGDSFVEVKDKGRMCKACFDSEQEDLQNQAASGSDVPEA